MVKDWFTDWLIDHLIRHAREGLPEIESEEGRVLYESWRKALVLKGVQDLSVATEASIRLVADPPRFPRDHFPALLAIAVGLYRDRNDGDAETPDTRDAAEAASRGCERCGGGGLAVVYHRRSTMRDLARDDRGRIIPPTVSAYCVCPAGRWIEANHRERSPDTRKRFPDLADVLAGRGSWLEHEPEYVEATT
jgi:hypothetical protein